MKKLIPLMMVPFALAACNPDEEAMPVTPSDVSTVRTASEAGTINFANLYRSGGRFRHSEDVSIRAIGIPNPSENFSFAPTPASLLRDAAVRTIDGYVAFSGGKLSPRQPRFDRGTFRITMLPAGAYHMEASTYICTGDVPTTLPNTPRAFDSDISDNEGSEANYRLAYLRGCTNATGSGNAFISMIVDATSPDGATGNVILQTSLVVIVPGGGVYPLQGQLTLNVRAPVATPDGGVGGDASASDAGSMVAPVPTLFGRVGASGLMLNVGVGSPVAFRPSPTAIGLVMDPATFLVNLPTGGGSSVYPPSVPFSVADTTSISRPSLLIGTLATLSALVPPEAQAMLYALGGFHRIVAQTGSEATRIFELTFQPSP